MPTVDMFNRAEKCIIIHMNYRFFAGMGRAAFSQFKKTPSMPILKGSFSAKMLNL